jgi:proline dehydrogenase
MNRYTWRHFVMRAARNYVAGPRLEDAIALGRSLSARGQASVLGYWDEGREAARQVLSEYLAAVEAAPSVCSSSTVAVKAPALGLDPGMLSELAVASRVAGVTLHFDSLGPETAPATLTRIEGLLRISTNLGMTLPGRWHRSRTDAERAIQLGLRTRIVKGQWADTDRTAQEPSEGFLEIARCLAGRARHVAVATHDVPLARKCLRILLQAGTSCELELLWGLPLATSLATARLFRVPVRIYVPYGQAWLPYAVSQFRTNPRVLFWIARDFLHGGTARQIPASGSAIVPG